MRFIEKPHHRVALLAAGLLGLMVVVVGLGVLGLTGLSNDFDDFAERDFPAFNHLLHVDRDLFRAEEALERAAASDSTLGRIDAVGEYEHQVERTEDRWSRYLEVARDQPGEADLQQGYVAAREVWLSDSRTLAQALVGGAPAGAQRAQLAATRDSFVPMREIVHRLEEDFYATRVAVERTGLDPRIQLLALLVIGLLAGGGASLAGYRATRRQTRAFTASDEELRRGAAQTASEADVDAALTMANSEAAATATISEIFAQELASSSVQLLLADSSNSHLHSTGERSADERQGCSVREPGDCPAIQRGATMRFTDSTAYSACPHLKNRAGDPCSAVCVPMSVAGRGVGVLHSVSDPDEGSESDVELMEVIARRAGDRIGLLRALAQSQTEAKTDPLTGLPNRRTLQEELGRLLDRQQDLALVYADLDQFKRVNDEFGHKAGDRALRVFARTLLTSVREDDLVARWGGEEFLIAFIDCDAQQASSRIEQIQAALSQALSDADTPSFTCSFGIADTSQSFDAETLLAQADEALLEAKRRGRDRMLVGSWQGPFDLEEWGRLIRDDGDGRPA